jgi:hypothetical protein
MTTPQQWDDACRYCRIMITYSGEYFKEQWRFEVFNQHDETVAHGNAESASDAGVLAKYRLCDYLDETVGVVR